METNEMMAMLMNRTMGTDDCLETYKCNSNANMQFNIRHKASIDIVELGDRVASLMRRNETEYDIIDRALSQLSTIERILLALPEDHRLRIEYRI